MEKKKKLSKKQYTKPQVMNETRRVAAAYVCCGLGSRSTCGINQSRIC